MRFPARPTLLFAFFAISLFGGVARASQPAATPSRLAAAIDGSRRVVLHGSVTSRATAAADRGAVSGSAPIERLQIMLKRSDAQQADLGQLLQDLHNPNSASFHKWLTPEEFGERFGPSDDDVAKLSAWLSNQGFTVVGLEPGRQVLTVSGTVGQFQSAFHAEIHHFTTPNGVRNSVATEPEIPAALAPVFGGFVSLNNFLPRSLSHVKGTAALNPVTHESKPNWTQGSNGSLSFIVAPADFATQYDLNTAYTAGTNGTGQTVAIVNESNINTHLVDLYRSLFSLPASPVQVIVDGDDPGINGVNNPYGGNGASIEAYLDVELAGAVAPNAKVDLVIAGDTAVSSGLYLAMERAVFSNVAPVMSLSFGTCELELGADNGFFSSLWQQAAAQGISVVVSSGDSGSAGCDDDDTQEYAVDGQQVNGMASTPYNIAVGGTDFYYSARSSTSALTTQLATYWNETPSNNTPTVSIKGVIPEQPWNDSQFGLNASAIFSPQATDSDTNIVAGSGGASTCGLPTVNGSGTVTACAPYPKPTWQSGTGVPADGVRDLPDVSLFAANGANFSYYPICASDGDCQPVASGGTVQVTGVGGTSASAPAFGGMLALVNQMYGRQGQANNVLYPLAKQFPAAFHDVTVGSISVPCNLTTDPEGDKPTNCIASSPTYYGYDENGNTVLEGQIGSGTTPEYSAATGYDLASGLGSIDASVLLADWNKVSFASTTVTLTPSATTFAHGTMVTVSGAVKSSGTTTPTGQVAVMTTSGLASAQGEVALTLASGSFSGSLNYLPGGTYTLYGRYSGDTVNAAGTSTPVLLTVTPEASGTVIVPAALATGGLVSSGVTLAYGATVDLDSVTAPSAQVTAETNCLFNGTTCPPFTSPTGSVTFADNSTTVNASPLNANGEGSFVWAPGLGTHSVVATYTGDASYNASASTAFTFSVAKATPGISGAINDYLGVGGANTLSILVENTADTRGTAIAPTGTITLTGITGVTSATLAAGIDPATGSAAGVATVSLPAVTRATNYSVGVSYPGDANYNAASTTVTASQAAQTGTAATTLSASLNGTTTSPTTGLVANVTVTGGTTYGAPTGYILEYVGGVLINDCVLGSISTSAASCAIPVDSASLPPGGNSITFQYNGNRYYQPSITTVTVSNPLSDFSLATATQGISVTAGSSTAISDLVTVSSDASFAGAVALTCSATNGVTCSIAPSSVTLTSGGLATATLSMNVSALTGSLSSVVTVTSADSTGTHGHTAAVVLTQPNPTDFTFTAASTSYSVTAGSSTAVTDVLSLGTLGAFAGTVSLTCAATNGVTCSLSPASVPLASGGTGTSTLSMNVSGLSATNTSTVTVTATSSTLTHTLIITLAPISSGSFTLSNGGAITIATQGGTGSTGITVTAVSGFIGSVNLSCSVTSSPAGASNPPGCSLAATPIAAGANTTLNVTTTAQTLSMLRSSSTTELLASASALVALALFWVPGAGRRRRWSRIALALVAATALGSLAGCGSSASGGGSIATLHGGTTTGTYVITVTGTDVSTGKISGSTAVTVNVN